MKGVISQCLTEMVEKKFGKEPLIAILAEAKLPGRRFTAAQDTPDVDVMNLIQATCKVLKISLESAAEAFGEHWCVDFAPRIYKAYYRKATGAKQFLMQMKWVHDEVTKNIPNARPPAFVFEEPAADKLVMKYSSPRHLEAIWIGCVKGVGVAFKERLRIAKLGPSAIEITFG